MQRSSSHAARAVLVSLFGALLTLSPAFADEQVLYHFPSYSSFAQGDLVRDDSGNLYGVTLRDGASGQGTVYRYSSDGQYTVLHDFGGGSDGAWPSAGLIRDADGNLYGATYYGGPSNQGTVFKVAPDGAESVLYAFKGGSDGANPVSRLMRDTRGNLYGTTMRGGNTDGLAYYGTVFRIASTGRKKTIYAFQTSNDAAFPAAGLISDSKGNLYGTTIGGGPVHAGAVYKIAADGHESVLAYIPSYWIGEPMGALVADEAGNLYGTTTNGSGMVFKVTSEGVLSELAAFRESHKAGQTPQSTLLIDSAGNLYGTATAGGHNMKGWTQGCGSVFKVTPRGRVQTLHLFEGGLDGCQPIGGLVADARGDFFGTTAQGGKKNGTIFRISP